MTEAWQKNLFTKEFLHTSHLFYIYVIYYMYKLYIVFYADNSRIIFSTFILFDYLSKLNFKHKKRRQNLILIIVLTSC